MAAKEWGLNPDEWEECSEEARVLMISTSRVLSKMELWELENRDA
jgi:hypothetical protein